MATEAAMRTGKKVRMTPEKEVTQGEGRLLPPGTPAMEGRAACAGRATIAAGKAATVGAKDMSDGTDNFVVFVCAWGTMRAEADATTSRKVKADFIIFFLFLGNNTKGVS